MAIRRLFDEANRAAQGTASGWVFPSHSKVPTGNSRRLSQAVARSSIAVVSFPDHPRGQMSQPLVSD